MSPDPENSWPRSNNAGLADRLEQVALIPGLLRVDADALREASDRLRRQVSQPEIEWAMSPTPIPIPDTDLDDRLVEYMAKASLHFLYSVLKDEATVKQMREASLAGARAALEVVRGGDLEQAIIAGYRYVGAP